MKIDLIAAGLAMPGLPGWKASQPVLRSEQPWQAAPLTPPPSTLLPANERRRAPLAVRLAFAAAEDAMQAGALDPAQWATVFASSDADTPIIHRIGTALAEPGRVVSPTDFHNSVHNAAAGYWSIAAGCRLPSTSLSAWDASFAAGLVEAATLALSEALPVLLVVYDMPPPGPLAACRAITEPAALALALAAPGTLAAPQLATLDIELAASDVHSPCTDPGLEALRLANPAARALPLLAALARSEAATLDLAMVSGGLRLVLSPA